MICKIIISIDGDNCTVEATDEYFSVKKYSIPACRIVLFKLLENILGENTQ